MKTNHKNLGDIKAVNDAITALNAAATSDYFINTTLCDSIEDRLAAIGTEEDFASSSGDTALATLADMHKRFKRALAVLRGEA